MRNLLVGAAAVAALATPVALAAPAGAATTTTATAATEPAGWVETGRYYYEAECVAAGSRLPLPPERWDCRPGDGYWGLWELR